MLSSSSHFFSDYNMFIQTDAFNVEISTSECQEALQKKNGIFTKIARIHFSKAFPTVPVVHFTASAIPNFRILSTTLNAVDKEYFECILHIQRGYNLGTASVYNSCDNHNQKKECHEAKEEPKLLVPPSIKVYYFALLPTNSLTYDDYVPVNEKYIVHSFKMIINKASLQKGSSTSDQAFVTDFSVASLIKSLGSSEAVKYFSFVTPQYLHPNSVDDLGHVWVASLDKISPSNCHQNFNIYVQSMDVKDIPKKHIKTPSPTVSNPLQSFYGIPSFITRTISTTFQPHNDTYSSSDECEDTEQEVLMNRQFVILHVTLLAKVKPSIPSVSTYGVSVNFKVAKKKMSRETMIYSSDEQTLSAEYIQSKKMPYPIIEQEKNATPKVGFFNLNHDNVTSFRKTSKFENSMNKKKSYHIVMQCHDPHIVVNSIMSDDYFQAIGFNAKHSLPAMFAQEEQEQQTVIERSVEKELSFTYLVFPKHLRVYTAKGASSGVRSDANTNPLFLFTLEEIYDDSYEEDGNDMKSVIPRDNFYRPKRKLALCIGNGNYEHLYKLSNCKNDAYDMASLLCKYGFNVTLKYDLKQKDFISQVKSFITQAKDGDLILLYYSGHGTEELREEYLLPIDCKEQQEAKYGLNLERDIMKVMNSNTHQAVFIVILDCCRFSEENDIFRGAKDQNTYPINEDLPKDISGNAANANNSAKDSLRYLSDTEFLLVFSCDPGASALMSPDDRNSHFTSALLQCMEAYPHETMEKILIMVGNQLTKIKKKSGGEALLQRPWYHSCLKHFVILDS